MVTQWTPMRWPNAWKDASLFNLLKDTSIDCLIFDTDTASLRAVAETAGLHTADLASPPPAIVVAKGEWPGVKMTRRASGDASSGPTGVPWVDSNGWKVQFERARQPLSAVWIQASPPERTRINGGSYLTAVADSAAHGGRWVIELDSDLATGIVGQNQAALATWKAIVSASGFFARHQEWTTYETAALVGVVSDFAGQNEFFSLELLNLLGRAGAHYQPMPKAGVGAVKSQWMRGLIYADADAPNPALRKRMLTFVEAGGLLVASPAFGPAGRASAENPRYSIRTLGKGQVAQSMEAPDDPYVWANDAMMLISHRYDLLRFWNGGATGSHITVSPDGKRAVAHLLFYSNRGPDMASVRVAGPWRSVKASTIEQDGIPNVGMEKQAGAVEVHLPQVSQYVALELEA